MPGPTPITQVFNVGNTLNATISSAELASSNVDISRGTGSPTFNSTIGQFTSYAKLGSGDNVIPFPPTIAHAAQVYIRNTSLNGTIAITWTPSNTNISVGIGILNPGDQIIFWTNPAGLTPGISALTLTANIFGIICEYFIGG